MKVDLELADVSWYIEHMHPPEGASFTFISNVPDWEAMHWSPASTFNKIRAAFLGNTKIKEGSILAYSAIGDALCMLRKEGGNLKRGIPRRAHPSEL